MNNPANMLRARIEFNRSRLKTLKERENDLKQTLVSSKIVNGTSPATIQAVREVFAESVEKTNVEMKNILQEMLKKSKKRKVSSKMFERIMDERRSNNAKAKVEKEDAEALSI